MLSINPVATPRGLLVFTHGARMPKPHGAILRSFHVRNTCKPRQSVAAQAFFGLFNRGGTATIELPTHAPAIDQLLKAVEGTDRGLSTTAEQQAEIDAAIAVLVEAGKEDTTSDDSLTATWKLVWTTEKETLFILKNAGWFGTKAGEVYQVIDVAEGSLQNVITFPPDGAFVVDSSLEADGRQRMNFKFRGATLKLPSSSLPLPPVGQGWFESVFMDERVRVAKDVRGDTLVVVRDGPPRKFV